MLLDQLGYPLHQIEDPSGGQVTTSDMEGADLLIGETIAMQQVIADRGGDANRMRDFRRIAARYVKLARDFFLAVNFTVVMAF